MFGVETTINGDNCRAINLPWFFQLLQNAAGDAGATGWWAAALVTALLFDQALIDPTSPTKAPLAGYENGVSIGALLWVIARLTVAPFLVASALARFDVGALGGHSVGSGSLDNDEARDDPHRRIDRHRRHSFLAPRSNSLPFTGPCDMTKRPNFLFFITDQQRADWLGC